MKFSKNEIDIVLHALATEHHRLHVDSRRVSKEQRAAMMSERAAVDRLMRRLAMLTYNMKAFRE